LPVELVGPDGTPSIDTATRVSSTRVRTLLRAGELAVANSLLGRPHEVRGVVGDGDKRARELGFPTANLEVPDEICLPRDGIYAAWYLRPDGTPHAAAVSLGRRPTFYDDQPFSLLEAHLLDFNDDLYGELGRVQFVARLRDELRFESVPDLVAQMARDCEQARRVLVG
jgi:riboflavin kinase / FMN adenylyltransferase